MPNSSSVYSDLRTAVAGLDPVQAMRATGALVEAHAINLNDAQQLSSSLAALRAIFRKLELWEQGQLRE
jgi:hypothetical protein